MKINNLPLTNHTHNAPSQSQSGTYEIRIKGFIDPRWDWLENMAVSYIEPDVTLISGRILDQSALHGFLTRIRDLNLTLLSVIQIAHGERGKEEENEHS